MEITRIQQPSFPTNTGNYDAVQVYQKEKEEQRKQFNELIQKPQSPYKEKKEKRLDIKA